MKIALYYPWIYLKSGVERSILEYIKRSHHEVVVFTNHFDAGNTFPGFKYVKVVELVRVPVKRSVFSVFKAALIIAFQKINLKGFDLLFVHSDGLGDLITIRNSAVPIVCYCHTPLRPVFDKYYRTAALKERSSASKIIFLFFSAIYKYFDVFLWRKYRYILFNSKETLRRAKSGGLISGGKPSHSVLYPGVNLPPAKYLGKFQHYFFLPGRIMWTKNIELAIRAFCLFKEKSPQSTGFRLVIAGHLDKKSKPYFARLKMIAGKRDDIVFVVSPTDREMNKLYKNAWAVLSSAFNEDFGITLLEGNSWGKPALAINRGGLVETQKNRVTGLLVGDNVSEYSQAMTNLSRRTREILKMGKAARKNAEQFLLPVFVAGIDRKLSWVAGNVT